MARKIFFNPRTSQYTMEEHDPETGTLNVRKIPPKFSLEDKYADLKREVRKEEYKKKELY